MRGLVGRVAVRGASSLELDGSWHPGNADPTGPRPKVRPPLADRPPKPAPRSEGPVSWRTPSRRDRPRRPIRRGSRSRTARCCGGSSAARPTPRPSCTSATPSGCSQARGGPELARPGAAGRPGGHRPVRLPDLLPAGEPGPVLRPRRRGDLEVAAGHRLEQGPRHRRVPPRGQARRAPDQRRARRSTGRSSRSPAGTRPR